MFDLPYLSSKFKTTQASVRTEHLYYKYIDYWIEPFIKNLFCLSIVHSAVYVYKYFSGGSRHDILYILYMKGPENV